MHFRENKYNIDAIEHKCDHPDCYYIHKPIWNPIQGWIEIGDARKYGMNYMDMNVVGRCKRFVDKKMECTK